MKPTTCCICNPNLPVNPHVCYRHKAAGLRLARQEGIRYVEAADRLYWEARDKQKTEVR
jgi:hypothetical protein